MDDKLPIFSHSDALAVALIDHAGAFEDDAETQAADTRQRAAAAALAEARRVLANAKRVPGYPREDLAALERRVTRADAEAATVEADLTAASVARLHRARRVRGEALTRALSRPDGVDPAADRLAQARLTERIEQDIEPGERGLMLKSAAKANTHPDLIRAALTAPQPAWPTAKWQPLVGEVDQEEIREWVIAHHAPESVKDIKACWRLGPPGPGAGPGPAGLRAAPPDAELGRAGRDPRGARDGRGRRRITMNEGLCRRPTRADDLSAQPTWKTACGAKRRLMRVSPPADPDAGP